MNEDLTKLYLMPLPETVLFPGMNLPILVYEELYKKLILECIKEKRTLGIILFEDDKLSEVGTIAEIIHTENSEDEGINALIEGKERFKVTTIIKKEPYLFSSIEPYTDIEETIGKQEKQSLKTIKQLTKEALLIYDSISKKKHSKKIKLPANPNELLFLIAGNLTCTPAEKQSILETKSITERIVKITTLLNQEIAKLNASLENKNTKHIVSQNGHLEDY